MDVSSKAEIRKLKKEMEARASEFLDAKKTNEGLEMQLHSLQQKNKDLEDEFRRDKNMWESTNSDLKGKLNKSEGELL